MSKKLNCWEYMNCGREKNGIMVPILGECKVYSDMKYDGLNNGVGAGRACWMSSNNNCIMRQHSQLTCCHECAFYKRVMYEEDEQVEFRFEPVNG